MANKSDLMDQNTKTKNLNSRYSHYYHTEEWVIIEYLLKELENNQDIELKTAPEYVIGYLVEKLRNRDLLTSKSTPKLVGRRANNDINLRLSSH